MENEKTKTMVAVVQARMNSTRLPKKVLLDLLGKPVLIRIIERLLYSKAISQIVVAATDHPNDAAIEKAVHKYYPEIPVFFGSENDLLDRLYQAVKPYQPSGVVRITGDSPLIDWQMVDQLALAFVTSNADYASTGLEKKTYPAGLDFEIFSFATLKKLWRQVRGAKEREFPALFIREHLDQFASEKIFSEKDYSEYRLTLDEPDDYKLIKNIYEKLYLKNPDFVMADILELLEKNPELAEINKHVQQRWKNY